MSKSETNVSKKINSSSKFVNENEQFRLYSHHSVAKQNKTINNEEPFQSTFPEFINEVMVHFHRFDDTLGVSWLEKVMRYNIYERKPYRGEITLTTFNALADESPLSQENIQDARYVAWCSKMLEASVQIADDIIDETKFRMGKPCWHTLPHVGIQAVNDALMLATGVFSALRYRLGQKKYYPQLLGTFIEASFTTVLGQTIDISQSKYNALDFSRAVQHKATDLKTGYFGSFMPVALGMNLCGYKDQICYNKVKDICCEISRLWTMRNDYLDCFSESIDIGATDIPQNKATWLFLTALEAANEQQREILKNCYGKNDPAKVERVKTLYLEMGIDELCRKAERESFKRINNMINDLSLEKIKPVLRKFNGDVIGLV